MEPIVIKGSPGGPEGKWEAVQAMQHEPFIFIQSCGSRWLGQEERDIAELLEVLANYRLRQEGFGGSYYTVNPCTWAHNPMWQWDSPPEVNKYVDGPRLYSCDGVVRFFGNFEKLSHVFNIDTNHKPTIDALIAAIENNVNVVETTPA